MTLEALKGQYIAQTAKSGIAFKKAVESIAGGVSANVKYFEPYPLFMKRGQGAQVTDLDDNTYVDYVLSYGPLILGHGRPEILKTIQEHFLRHGTMLYGTPHEMESTFAEKIKSYFPGMERIRYTNSGTEATLLCIRYAYAYTGRQKIAKIEGHYHGGFNQVLFSVNPDLSKAGDAHNPVSLPESAGLTACDRANTLVLPFNDLESCTEILTRQKDEIAAVILEPVLAGYIPATREFMTGLRKVTKRLGILMILDEVKTGFRVTMGGAQKYYGITPDLTALGKVIGGGFPIGIVGGRKDVLMQASPVHGSDILNVDSGHNSSSQEVLFHSGTYNGHPLILSVGMKTLEILETELPGIISRTESLKEGIRSFYATHGIRVLTPGLGTMFNISITGLDAITQYRDMQKSDFELRKKMDYALLLEGVYNKPGNRYNLSSAHTDAVIESTLEAYEKAFRRL